jgi:DNA-binding CsgD family transcriptional regulator
MHAGSNRGLHVDKLAAFLETAYDFESDDRAWLVSVMQAARAVCGRGAAMHGGIFDASNVHALRFHQVHMDGFTQEGEDLVVQGRRLLSPSVVRTFRSNRVIASGRSFAELAPLYASMAPLQLRDTLFISGSDPCGHGIFVGLWYNDPGAPPAQEIAIYARMAHHLAAAHRCRLRLRVTQADRAQIDPSEGAEAILDGQQRIVHASGPATSSDAQRQLMETAKAREQARTRRGDVAEGLRRWRALTAARWTLVDRVDRNGERYVAARDNRPEVAGLVALSERERQVVAYAVVNQSAQETAYTLGISAATVRMLLGRAGSKLGAQSREQLMQHPEVRALKPA